MSDFKEKRKHERIKSTGVMKVYTSISAAKYTVNIGDISKGGAFIRTKHLPKIGEIITYIIVDDKTFKELFIGNAEVAWIKEKGDEKNVGFGIELEKELTDEIFATLKNK